MQFLNKNILSAATAIIISWSSYGQEGSTNATLDNEYREDQFYLGVTYNLLTAVPNDIAVSGFSGGIHLGFLRDMPINERRNIAIAVGVGLSFDKYGQNLFIGEDNNENTIFSSLVGDVDYSINRFSTATIELPIEFRWRTSTAKEYKFWRIYSGLKTGYTYWYRSQFKQTNNEVSQTKIPEFQKLQVAATLAFGYGTFNFYASYSVLPFFKDATLSNSNEAVDFKPLKLGIIFYIL